MKLSASNIAWSAEQDDAVLRYMADHGFSGLEIAPTRVFPEKPYEDLKRASDYASRISSEYGLEICSMQSIWYGQTGRIFGSDEERQALTDYTKKAIDFTEAMGCGNLVFGCPRNRVIPENGDVEIAVRFFRELGDYAAAHHTVLAMEANPPIYNTNFINRTDEAIDLIERVDSKGFLLNLDVGTMIENGESVGIFEGREQYINHVHISEPGLKPIRKRGLHGELAEMLRRMHYSRFVSIEVGKQADLDLLAVIAEYVTQVFEQQTAS